MNQMTATDCQSCDDPTRRITAWLSALNLENDAQRVGYLVATLRDLVCERDALADFRMELSRFASQPSTKERTCR